jgi:hypothetical protein
LTPVVVFLGPTLAWDEARAVLDADYRPPAGHGDVLRAAVGRPRAIALVDGIFEQAPAVWHKELLFALSEGVQVYGAASMGALRAAELDTFGMRGVGQVYRAYAAGAVEDDDEVAVAHADGEHAFRALSDSMVDVRATLAAAVSEGVVSGAVADLIAARVKARFYPQRTLVAALDEEHSRLRAWLREGWISQKRLDALELLRLLRTDLDAGLPPFRASWTFQRTRYWEAARRSVELAASDDRVPVRDADEQLEAVLDELRLDPEAFRDLLDRSLLVALALDAATTAGVDVSAWAHQAALDGERRRRGLLTPGDVSTWLAERNLDDGDLAALSRSVASLRWAHDTYRASVASALALTLRTDKAYVALAQRACDKRAMGENGVAPDDEQLIAWYFRDRLQQDVPPAPEAWASAHGWSRGADFLRALRAEWRFTQTCRQAAALSRMGDTLGERRSNDE